MSEVNKFRETLLRQGLSTDLANDIESIENVLGKEDSLVLEVLGDLKSRSAVRGYNDVGSRHDKWTRPRLSG